MCTLRPTAAGVILWLAIRLTANMLGQTKIMEISENKEMYLVTLAMLLEEGAESPIAVSQLAEELEILPVSANEMVRKLSKEGYVRYTPYKGVELLAEGKALAHKTLRHRRLWEVFLADKLGLPLSAADALACRLEHITSAEVAERLFIFLEEPTTSAQGKPIPASGAGTAGGYAKPLSEHEAGDRVEIVRLDMEPPGTAFLAREGIKPGTLVEILASSNQGDKLLQAGKNQVHIVGSLSEQILVSEQGKPGQE